MAGQLNALKLPMMHQACAARSTTLRRCGQVGVVAKTLKDPRVRDKSIIIRQAGD